MHVSKNINTPEETFEAIDNEFFMFNGYYGSYEENDQTEIIKIVYNTKNYAVAFIDTDLDCIVFTDTYAIAKLASDFIIRANEILDQAKWFSAEEYRETEMIDLGLKWNEIEKKIENPTFPEDMNIEVSVIDNDGQKITIGATDSIFISVKEPEDKYDRVTIGGNVIIEGASNFTRLVVISGLRDLFTKFLLKMVRTYDGKDLKV